MYRNGGMFFSHLSLKVSPLNPWLLLYTVEMLSGHLYQMYFSDPAFVYAILSLSSFIILMYARGCVFKTVNNNSKRIHLLILCVFIGLLIFCWGLWTDACLRFDWIFWLTWFTEGSLHRLHYECMSLINTSVALRVCLRKRCVCVCVRACEFVSISRAFVDDGEVLINLLL